MSGRKPEEGRLLRFIGLVLEEEVEACGSDFPYTVQEMRKLPVSIMLGPNLMLSTTYWPRSYVFQTWDYMESAPQDQYAEDLELYKRILFREPLEEMPLYLHQESIERLFAEWRLEIGK